MRTDTLLCAALPQDLPGRVAIEDIRPTQATVGLREVAAKRRRWRRALACGRQERFADRRFPVVIGPAGRLYAIDGHHWMRALLEEGVRTVAVAVVGRLASLSEADFWPAMAARGWCHAHDAAGATVAYADMPTSMAALLDDPFRSLATGLRRAGAVAKQRAPFSEFACAEFLRRRIPLAVAQQDYGAALTEALRLVRPKAQPLVRTGQPGSEGVAVSIFSRVAAPRSSEKSPASTISTLAAASRR